MEDTIATVAIEAPMCTAYRSTQFEEFPSLGVALQLEGQRLGDRRTEGHR